MSKLEVNAVEPQCGTNLTLGASGDTIIIPSGATISNQGTAAGFGPTGAVSWDTTKKTTGFTAVTGVGYFADTTSAAFTITLPATPAAGAVVGITDYANTFATNNITVARNGSNIGGNASNAILFTNGVAVTFVYVDATQGWIVTDSGNRSDLPTPEYVAATGGTITCCGNFKIHTFTGPGTFTVTNAGNPAGSATVDYLVVAGGGGSMYDNGGGGGAGGFRYSNSTFTVPGAPGAPLASATGLPVTATAFPITVGAGGAGIPFASSPTTGNAGVPSTFSTITSAGGGIGVACGGNSPYNSAGQPGGSGGGAGQKSTGPGLGGSGNTPPTSPPQGNTGGASTGGCAGGAGGGGAMAVGSNTPGPGTGGAGGIGAGIPTAFGSNGVPSGGYQYYAGGGGGGGGQPGGGGPGAGGTGGGGAGGGTTSPGSNGTPNTGGGAGGGGQAANGANGGSGIVVIRYRFQ
jgi:hypothetical protein